MRSPARWGRCPAGTDALLDAQQAHRIERFALSAEDPGLVAERAGDPTQVGEIAEKLLLGAQQTQRVGELPTVAEDQGLVPQTYRQAAPVAGLAAEFLLGAQQVHRLLEVAAGLMLADLDAELLLLREVLHGRPQITVASQHDGEPTERDRQGGQVLTLPAHAHLRRERIGCVSPSRAMTTAPSRAVMGRGRAGGHTAGRPVSGLLSPGRPAAGHRPGPRRAAVLHLFGWTDPRFVRGGGTRPNGCWSDLVAGTLGSDGVGPPRS